MRASTTKNNLKTVLKGALALVSILAVWQMLADIVGDAYFLPGVPETVKALVGLFGIKDFPLIILFSLLRVALGLTLGIAAGIILATLTHLLPFTHSVIQPAIAIMKATPIAAIILILWFTFSDTSLAVFVVFLMVTPIIWQNVYDGYKSISADMLEVCSAFEFSRFKTFRLLVFPSVSRYLIPAVITSMGLAWKAEIAAEIMTYSNIGKSIQNFKTLHFDTASVFAWATVIVVISLILEALTKKLLGRVRRDS